MRKREASILNIAIPIGLSVGEVIPRELPALRVFYMVKNLHQKFRKFLATLFFSKRECPVPCLFIERVF